MGTKTWITIAIIAAIIIAILGFISAVPFWVTLSCLVAGIAGGFIGYKIKGTFLKKG